MKRTAVLVAVVSLMLAACTINTGGSASGSSSDTEATDTGDTDTGDTGDTGDTDTGDTDTGDSPAPTAAPPNTEPADPAHCTGGPSCERGWNLETCDGYLGAVLTSGRAPSSGEVMYLQTECGIDLTDEPAPDEPPPDEPDLLPGDGCNLGSTPDCIDPDGDGIGTYLIGGADCVASFPDDLGLCEDLDGDGVAGFPDAG